MSGDQTSTRQYFGTDGVRGEAGSFLDAGLALRLARATTELADSDRPRVLILRDTRESGEMLESAVAAGVAQAGGEALIAGVLPTPAAPLLLAQYGFDLGVVISASHNVYSDNGIKFFGADGFKLTDKRELEIERKLEAPTLPASAPGRVRHLHGALGDYVMALRERFGSLDLSGRKIALDCANGATFEAAPEIFRKLGAEVGLIACDPDGRNINDNCGSTHIEGLQEFVSGGDWDLGFAFDGDGDRLLAVDSAGEIFDGDQLIAIAARYLQQNGRLTGDGVAVTVMTNFGFFGAMEADGIEVATTDVGDRYVIEALRERGWSLGGEQSGHIIQMDFVQTGDGIAAALATLEALGDKQLAQSGAMKKLPQVLINVRVADREAASASTELQAAVERESEALSGIGRVLVRPSGTEPLIRVMVEAPTPEAASGAAERIASTVVV